MMEFKTPPSYGDTVVNVACIVTEDELIGGGTKSKAEHLESKLDPVPNWPEPTHLKYTWDLNGKDGKPVTATIEYAGERRERVDIMGEVPQVVKKIIGGVAGTKPYIYQVRISWIRVRPLLTKYFSTLPRCLLSSRLEMKRSLNKATSTPKPLLFHRLKKLQRQHSMIYLFSHEG